MKFHWYRQYNADSEVILGKQNIKINVTVVAMCGMFFAVLILKNIDNKLEDYFIKNPYINLSTAFFATIVLILFGAIAGYVPAKRAASIKPIVALRDE